MPLPGCSLQVVPARHALPHVPQSVFVTMLVQTWLLQYIVFSGH
jgi:hypothetical protein